MALLALSFVFGGASRQHALRLALVELVAVPLLVMGLQALIKSDAWRRHSFLLGMGALLCALPLLQLAPLPPSIWEGLPGRSDLVLGLSLTGIQPGWAPLSLTPDLTWQAVLALVPPMAMLLAALQVSKNVQEKLIWAWLGLAVLGITLAAAQIAAASPRLYPWSWTEPGLATGFFANRNHMAALCTTALPFALACSASALADRGKDRRLLWIGLGLTVLLVAAIATIRSRAGIALALPSLAASLVATWRMTGRRGPDKSLMMIAGAVLVMVAVTAAFALTPILARFESLPLSNEGRFDQWPIVIEAAQAYLPVGSGIGSFDAVFRSVEPLSTLDATYFNAAHNEYLQIWLEAGWPGIALLAAFVVWYVRRSWSAWREGQSQERNLQRAASISILLILAHSFVDYPLRTETLMVFFALCCGILEFAGKPRGLMQNV